MVYYRRRNNYGRRYFGRRKRFGVRRMMTGASMAKTALRKVNKLNSIVKSELKTIDHLFPTPQSGIPTITSLTSLIQGTDYNQRIGRSIRLKSVQYQGNIGMNASATSTLYRIVIFVDNDNTGTPPASTDIGIGTVNDIRSSNPNAMKRFTILQDRLIRMATGNVLNFPLKGFRRLNHSVKYDGTAAIDTSQGSLWLLTVSDQAINQPSITCTARVRYWDN